MNQSTEGARMAVEEGSGDIVLKAEGLVKTFGRFTAVDHMDVSVRRGEIYGFLGPNGAGKTTTIRMLTTMERPTSGKVEIEGYDTATAFLQARRKIGIIQQQHSLDKDLSVRENIMHHALMQNLSLKEAKAKMKELCALMELDDRMDQLASTLSGGWRKRVTIVCALLHDPEILFLDEPTTGLDTQSRNLLWRMIRNINRKGTTIFLTTHYIFEAESLCDRVGIIDKGRMIAEGTPEELRSRVGNVALASVDPEGVEHVSYHNSIEAAKEASLALPHDRTISIRASNLEDVFLELTGGKL